MNFEIRYAILDSKLIFNSCGPESTGPVGWTEELIMKRKKNSEKYISNLNRKSNFYNKLEESILIENFRNPILVRCGWCPDRVILKLPLAMQEDANKILVCDSSGGSRLWVAQNHGLNIPCIIMDFIGRFSNKPLVEKTTESILKFFKDTPKNIVINDHGVGLSNLPQVGEF